MPNQTTNQHKKRRRSPLGKRQLSSKVTSSNLWIPDRQMFEETARKRHLTDAEFLREIVHRWCVVERLAPDTEEGAQEIALLNLQKETKKAIEEVGQDLFSLLKQIAEAVATHGDLLSLNEAHLNHVTSVAGAHYNVSAQSFAALWSLVEMFQRFYVERSLPERPDQHQAAVAIRDDIRGEGLRMIETFGSLCESTTPIKMILIYPSAGDPNT